MTRLARQREWWITLLLVGLALGPLLVGIEPVGGDPDRLYRPLKTELVRAFADRTLPFWSDRIGLGVPLLAESHVGALYPWNHLLYRIASVNAAYRLSMWGHMVALAAGLFLYARSLGLEPAGAGLSAVSFSLCGFLAIHSSHEWAYQTVAYLPWLLLCVQRFFESARMVWASAFALLLAAGWTAGHFQVLTWSAPMFLLASLVPRLTWRQRLIRTGGIGAAWCLGSAIAAAQLGPSLEYARFVNPEQRTEADRAFYAFPPAHWTELVIPRLFREIEPEAPYWFSLSTTGYEAALYVGTIPLVLAVVGLLSRTRAGVAWVSIAVITAALATMPHWWPLGYRLVLRTPGVGLFRCPARWTLFTSLALSVLAGIGFTRCGSIGRFWVGNGLSVGLLAAAFFVSSQSLDRLGLDGRSTGPFFLRVPWAGAALAWVLAVASLIAWRAGRIAYGVPLVLTAVELSILYYSMTTDWGWSVDPRGSSAVLSRLAETPGVGRIGGELDNLPLRAGLSTAEPYIGFPLPQPSRDLHHAQAAARRFASVRDSLRLLGVTHLVIDRSTGPTLAMTDTQSVWSGSDPVLDRLARSPRAGKQWEIHELGNAVTQPRVIEHVRHEAGRRDSARGSLDFPTDRAEAVIADSDRSGIEHLGQGSLESWDGQHAVVRHSGPVGLLLPSQYDPGWEYRVDGEAWRPASAANGGLLYLTIEGRNGTSEVDLRYRPPRWLTWVTISTGSLAVALLPFILAAARFGIGRLVRAPRIPG